MKFQKIRLRLLIIQIIYDRIKYQMGHNKSIRRMAKRLPRLSTNGAKEMLQLHIMNHNNGVLTINNVLRVIVEATGNLNILMENPIIYSLCKLSELYSDKFSKSCDMFVDSYNLEVSLDVDKASEMVRRHKEQKQQEAQPDAFLVEPNEPAEA